MYKPASSVTLIMIFFNKSLTNHQGAVKFGKFSFTIFSLNDSNFISIEKNYLYEVAVTTSKIASTNLQEPFKLLIDYSGVPESNDWGVIITGDLWDTIVTHFEFFAERVFKFNLSNNDLHCLRSKRPDSMSSAAVRLFDIFRDDYLLPTLRAMKSKQIKLDTGV